MSAPDQLDALRKTRELLHAMLDIRSKILASGILPGADFNQAMEEHVAGWLWRELSSEYERGKQEAVISNRDPL